MKTPCRQAISRVFCNGYIVFYAIVMTAYRQKTVRSADYILVLEGRHIVQRGIHDELSLKKSLFHQIFCQRRNAFHVVLTGKNQLHNRKINVLMFLNITNEM